MNSPFEDTPENLVALQTTVRDWVKTARDSVESFYRNDLKDGTFWRDSNACETVLGQKEKKEEEEEEEEEEKGKDKRSLTTTSRSYIALAYADRCLSKDENSKSPDWVDAFKGFFAQPVLKISNGDLKEIPLEDGSEEPKDLVVNIFDVAHLADLKFTHDYVSRFLDGGLPEFDKLLEGAENKIEDSVCEILQKEIKKKSKKHKAQLSFGDEESFSEHYFITLHSLRAFSIWSPEKIGLVESHIPDICKSVRQFCTEQCFYSQKGILHKQDTIRLAFAGVIYCLYAEEVDKELLLAVVEALEAAQRENGSWLATHPIIRNENKPWHITSHEIALCLTWLYFQPRIPDTARPLLLRMMERYFVNWVVPTFVRVSVKLEGGKLKEFMGWYDDHTITDNFAVGWATAIVCHFLANYHAVLDDHINRRVIETIGLAPFSKRYLIDADTHEASTRWRNRRDSDGVDFWAEKRPSVTWPDLSPFAWGDEPKLSDLKSKIEWLWTDPSPGAKISEALAEKVLSPVFGSPNGNYPVDVPRI